ncbi:carboxypeptidase regulatory-like domain-containing protein [Sphingomonas sp.]|uniref:TonB-dependent receptor n=1 Tax=Sphingomonas sp. TaxID=28214 RepID=UPI0025F299B0|nr:carboxypeptidase regulatory-like domain-containing protein [Sphingomonas sp.]
MAALVMPAAAYAQETTATIRGTVTANGTPVADAQVVVTDVASGTKLQTKSDGAGAFTAAGLRAGGPYSVEVTSASGSTTVTDIYTVVGQPYELPVDLTAQAAQGGTTNDIVVTASRVRGAGVIGSGPATVLTAQDISKVASVNRDIRDLMRRDPFATLDTSQSTGRQVTFAGTNPRFNRFTVDGVPITDSFGLNPDALPSRRGPVPLDSIGEFQTKVAPYDIREGFFQGGVINAVLRSGTNSFQGTGFYSINTDGLTGEHLKPYVTNTTGYAPQPKFSSKDYGVELSGPIIKDKLFFMIAAERVRATNPFNVAANSLTQAQYDQITSIAKTKYGVDAGGKLTSQGDKDDRIVGRIDANIATGQRLSLTGIYTKDAINVLGFNSATSQSTLSNDYVKPNRLWAGVATLNSTWSPVLSTETRVMYKDYKSGQNPILAKTALALVCSDAGTSAAITVGTATQCSSNVTSLGIGPLGSAQTNVLQTKTFDVQELMRFSFGDHNVRALYDYQHVSNYNLFIGQTAQPAGISSGAYGAYYFDSIAAFQAGTAQAFGYANATTGNPNDAAARFSYATHTFGLQDDWRVNSSLTVTAGVRYDLFGGHDRPLVNAAFVAREGFNNNAFVSGRGLFQPRVGFDWKATSRLNIHGGVGIFGGGTPDVYIGNSFSSSGVQPVLYSTTTNAAFLNNVSLTSVPAGATAALNGLQNSPVAALDPNFKIASQYRGSLSATYDFDLGPLGDRWQLGASVLASKVRQGLLYRDGRARPLTNSDGSNSLTPDGRQRYYDITPTSQGGPSGNADTILGNTTRGHGYIGVVSLRKKWDFGLGLFGSFTYQDVKDQAAVTSSIASSNYGNTAYFDANGGAFGHSNDEVRYSFKYSIDFDHAFFGDYKTRIQLFGETRIGSPYSYTMQDAATVNGRSAVFGTAGNTSRFLFYVPTGINDPKVTYSDIDSSGNSATATRIDQIINSTGLSKYRGMIAPRNAFNSKWFTKLDLHVEQEIPTFIGKSRISLFADIENLPNLINHNWGEQLRNFFPFTDVVTRVACQTVGSNPCGKYVYSSPSSDTFLADQLITVNGSSLYSIRVGARVSF